MENASRKIFFIHPIIFVLFSVSSISAKAEMLYSASQWCRIVFEGFIPSKKLPKNPSFSDFKSSLQALSKTSEQLVREIVLASPPIGQGHNAIAFPIPKMEGYLILISIADYYAIKKGKALDFSEFEEIPDIAPGRNFGQQIARVGPAVIVKRQSGVTMSGLRGKPAEGPEHERGVRISRARLWEAARMPQASYDQLVRDFRDLEVSRFNWDRNHGDNLMIDFRRGRFGIIDLLPHFTPGTQVSENPEESLRKLLVLARKEIIKLPESERTERIADLDQFEKLMSIGVNESIDASSIAIALIDNPSAHALGKSPSVLADRKKVLRKLAIAAHNAKVGFGTIPCSSVNYSFELAGIDQTPVEFGEESVRNLQ